MAQIDGLPRLHAVLLVGVAVSMLAFGLRASKTYVRLLFATAAWVGGGMLGKMMVVTEWYVALPAALIALGLVWRVAGVLRPLVIGFVAGCGVGVLLVKGFEIDMFWAGFAGGAGVGVALALVASRFITALFCAVSGAVVIVSGIGAVVRLPGGMLSVGAYERYPMMFLVTGAVLFIVSMVTQVALEPDLPEDVPARGSSS
ncbi:MAG: hypothetical protein HY903_05945 [Deltaproteobacteria bacterium]|nr:hypothetical protein [Deltaproteobacteria bacterium]